MNSRWGHDGRSLIRQHLPFAVGRQCEERNSTMLETTTVFLYGLIIDSAKVDAGCRVTVETEIEARREDKGCGGGARADLCIKTLAALQMTGARVEVGETGQSQELTTLKWR
jgi:hypothetical protein